MLRPLLTLWAVALAVVAAKHATIDFAIIGVEKAGTTFFAVEVLRKHPMINLNRHELHFWDHCQRVADPCEHNWTQLLKHGIAEHDTAIASMPLNPECTMKKWVKLLGAHPSNRLWGDKTPRYIAQPQYASQMAELAPNLKLIAILRNPVDRAWSAFRMERQHFERDHAADEAGSWYDRHVSQNTEFKQLVQRLKTDQRDVCVNTSILYDLVYRGMYADQLQYYFHAFPQDQILVLIAEDIWKYQNYSKVDELLGLSPPLDSLEYDTLIAKEKKSSWINDQRSDKVPEEAREILQKIFEPANRRLCAMLKLHGYACPDWAPNATA